MSIRTLALVCLAGTLALPGEARAQGRPTHPILDVPPWLVGVTAAAPAPTAPPAARADARVASRVLAAALDAASARLGLGGTADAGRAPPRPAGVSFGEASPVAPAAAEPPSASAPFGWRSPSAVGLELRFDTSPLGDLAGRLLRALARERSARTTGD